MSVVMIESILGRKRGVLCQFVRLLIMVAIAGALYVQRVFTYAFPPQGLELVRVIRIPLMLWHILFILTLSSMTVAAIKDKTFEVPVLVACCWACGAVLLNMLHGWGALGFTPYHLGGFLGCTGAVAVIIGCCKELLGNGLVQSSEGP